MVNYVVIDNEKACSVGTVTSKEIANNYVIGLENKYGKWFRKSGATYRKYKILRA